MFVSLFQNAEVKKSLLGGGGGGVKMLLLVILDVCGLNSTTEEC